MPSQSSKPTPADSSTWRVGKSESQVIEMANAIRTLSRVVGNLDQDTKSVAFSGNNLSYNNRNARLIRIDPKHAMGGVYPIPDEEFDVLVGLSVHEAMHSRAETELVGELSYSDLMEGRITFGSIAAVGEEVYADQLARRISPTAYGYVRKARIAYGKGNTPDDWDNIPLSWSRITIYGTLPTTETPQRTLRALGVLSKLSLELGSKDIRCIGRTALYHRAVMDLETISREVEVEKKLSKDRAEVPSDEDWGGLDPDKPGIPTDNKEDPNENTTEDSTVPGDEPNKDDDANKDSSVPPNDPSTHNADTYNDQDNDDHPVTITSDLAQSLSMDTGGHMPAPLEAALNEAMNTGLEDYFGELAKLGAAAVEDIGGIETSRSMPNPELQFNHGLYKQLVWMKMLHNASEKVIYRGRDTGRIDGRQLYRAKVDHKPFKRMAKLPLHKNKMVLLLDGSASMDMGYNRHNRVANPVYLAAAAINRVLDEVDIYSYNAVHGLSRYIVKITEHSSRTGSMDVIEPIGGTPTGVALLTTASRFPDAIIIHFSDGESTVGITPYDAWDIISKNFPKTRIIDIRYRLYDRRVKQVGPLEESDRVKVINIDSLDDFATTLRDAIKPWY